MTNPEAKDRRPAEKGTGCGRRMSVTPEASPGGRSLARKCTWATMYLGDGNHGRLRIRTQENVRRHLPESTTAPYFGLSANGEANTIRKLQLGSISKDNKCRFSGQISVAIMSFNQRVSKPPMQHPQAPPMQYPHLPHPYKIWDPPSAHVIPHSQAG